MNQIETFKLWLQTFLIKFDKDIDTEIYLDYMYEILSNYSSGSNDKDEIIESIHSILESLLPDVKSNVSERIFDEYCAMLIIKENEANNFVKSDTDILTSIIRNDQNAIDKNKRSTKIDPRYALDYVRGDEEDSDDDSFSDSEINAEFAAVRVGHRGNLDEALEVLSDSKAKTNTDREEALAATKMMMSKKYNSDDDSDDSDFDPSMMAASGRSNREAVDKANQESRLRLKEKSQQKKDKDKQDRTKQKEQQKARKEGEKKRTQKSERRR